MITLYGFPQSRSRRAIWTLEEIGLPYEYVPVDLRHRRAGERPLEALNPASKVPILEEDGFILTESAAICLYLAEKDPERRLLPADEPRQMARLHQWLSFAITELEQPLWTRAKHQFALPKAMRIPEIEKTAHYEFNEATKILDAGLGQGPWLLGDRFSIADVLVANALSWSERVAWPLESDRLDAYLATALARPAYARALARE